MRMKDFFDKYEVFVMRPLWHNAHISEYGPYLEFDDPYNEDDGGRFEVWDVSGPKSVKVVEGDSSDDADIIAEMIRLADRDGLFLLGRDALAKEHGLGPARGGQGQKGA
jgi:hypothetical protein